MTRRDALVSLAGLGLYGCGGEPEVVPETAQTHKWHLRYAPKMGLLGDELSVDQHLQIYAEYGFTAFEYNNLPRNHTLEECESIRRKMNELRMDMGVFVVNRGGSAGDALVDVRFHDGFLEDVRKAVQYRDVMGNRWATVTSGLSVDYLPLSRQTGNVVDGLKKAADIVEGTDLTLVLEPLNVLVNHPGYHVVTSEHGAQIIDAVGSSHVKLLFDIYHQQISEGNLINNLEKHWDRIAYIQAGDVPGRNEPYTGEINYQNVFKRIYEKGYEGMIGMEHGLSEPGREGLQKCFEAYRVADTWG